MNNHSGDQNFGQKRQFTITIYEDLRPFLQVIIRIIESVYEAGYLRGREDEEVESELSELSDDENLNHSSASS